MRNKGFSPIIVLVFVALLALGLLALRDRTTRPEKEPSPTPTSKETRGKHWKQTSLLETGGWEFEGEFFSLKYPFHWTVGGEGPVAGIPDMGLENSHKTANIIIGSPSIDMSGEYNLTNIEAEVGDSAYTGSEFCQGEKCFLFIETDLELRKEGKLLLKYIFLIENFPEGLVAPEAQWEKDKEEALEILKTFKLKQ